MNCLGHGKRNAVECTESVLENIQPEQGKGWANIG